MIALYLRWSGELLAPQLAERLGASLNLGQRGGVSVRQTDGVVVATTHADLRSERTWKPIRISRGDLLLFDGYLLDQQELARKLGVVSSPMLDDAALYAKALSAWGDACDLRVNGCYAAITWCERDKSVRLARSPITAPPLHVWQDDDRLIVASTARALFATGEVQKEVDEQKIADALYLNYAEGTRGWFKGVFRAPGGSHCFLKRGVNRTRRYYDVEAVSDVRLHRDEDYVSAADALLEAGTRTMLAPFTQPAISLSGGYDSQAVAHFALRALPPTTPLLAFTHVPAKGWEQGYDTAAFGDERSHVAALAEMYPQLTVEYLDTRDLSLDHKLDALFLLAGAAPRNVMNLVWIHKLRARVAARGCDVLLTGAMGNASFSFNGNGTLPSLFKNGRWTALSRELRTINNGRSRAENFGRKVVMPLLPRGLYETVSRLRGGNTNNPFGSWCPLNPDYARDMRVQERAIEMGSEPMFQPFSSTRAFRAALISAVENESGDMHQALQILHGIPHRDPTAYRPLIEFCMGIPDEQFLRLGQSRWLARRILSGKIPEEVRQEQRRGIQSADWHLTIKRDQASLMAELDRLSTDPKMARRLNIGAIRHALEQFISGGSINSNTHALLGLALPRAVAAARFIRFVEGTNDG